jgi:hypothetical protein
MVDGALHNWSDADAAAQPLQQAPPASAPETPPAAPPVASPPAAPAPPTAGLAVLQWHDATSDSARPYLFWAKRRCTFGAEALSKSSSNADLVLTYNPAVDEPLDKPNLLRLTFNWGPAQRRTAEDGVLSARVGEVTHRWSSYDDRVVDSMYVESRAASENLRFQLSGRGFVWSHLANGGYAFFDVGTFERFVIQGPSVTDASGKVAGGNINLNYPDASITLDAGFLSRAAYPLTVSMTTQYAMISCFPGTYPRPG